MDNSQRPTFYYVYDALCGWCYGFSPVMKAFFENHRDDFEFKVVSGGMVMGERSGPIGEVASYIKGAHKQVEDKAGVKFGEAFIDGLLEEGTAQFSSLQPAIAMSVFRSFKPEEQISFAHDLQQMIYNDGIGPEEIGHYGKIASKYGIAESDFNEAMGNEEMIKDAFGDFEIARQLDVRGFPSAFIYRGDTFYMVVHGFCEKELLERRVTKVMETPLEDPV